MAKQVVGPLVRYLDKAVLGACGVVFLYFVAMFGVMSPVKSGPEGQQLGPSEVDPQIKSEAERLREKLLNAEAPPENNENKFVRPDLRRLDNVLALAKLPEQLPSPVPPGAHVPLQTTTVQPQQPVDLAEIIALGKPKVQTGRSGIYLSEPGDFKGGEPPTTSNEAVLVDANWATTYATFDRATQERMFREANYRHNTPVLMLGIDVARRIQQPGGAWSEWSPVQTSARMALPPLPKPTVERTATGVYDVPDKERKAIDDFFALITEGANDEAQCDLLRPLFPITAYGDPWQMPKTDGASVLQMDADFQKEPRCRYPECQSTTESIPTGAEFDDLMEEAEEALAAQKFETALKYAEAAKAVPQISSRDQKKADDLIEKIKVAQAKAEQERTGREPLPEQLVWAHDASAGGLLSGRTYQYRVRARVYNRFAGKPALLKDPQQASIVEQVGPWSEPSEPVTIEPDTVIFAKSVKARAEGPEVKVIVFKWFAGKWLDRQFTTTTGDTIGEVKTVEAPPDGGKQPVDFTTGARVVDVDYRRKVLLPGRRGGRLESKETEAVIVVDASGNLHEHLVEFDKSSDTYKRYHDLAWKAP